MTVPDAISGATRCQHTLRPRSIGRVGACRIGIVSNAQSRDNRLRRGAAERFTRILGDRGEVAVTHSLVELDAAVARFRDAGVELFGMHGGDGTIHHTLTALIRGYGTRPLPRLLVLRGGTMNTLAHGLGIKGRHGNASRLLVRALEREPKVTRRYVVNVGDRYCLIFGNGIMYTFAKAYYDLGTPQPWTAAQLLSRVVGSAVVGGPLARRLLAPWRARITSDGVTWTTTEFLTIAVASVPEAGYGFAMLPHATDGLDGLAVTAVHTTPRELVAELPKMLLGRPLRPDRCTLATTRRFVLEADAPVGYTLDGDCYIDAARIEISAGPQVEIVIPDAS
jgi:diacylglycerol kinase (ATP)